MSEGNEFPPSRDRECQSQIKYDFNNGWQTTTKLQPYALSEFNSRSRNINNNSNIGTMPHQ